MHSTTMKLFTSSCYLSTLISATSAGNLGVKPVKAASSSAQHTGAYAWQIKSLHKGPTQPNYCLMVWMIPMACFTSFFCPADCKPKSNKYPKQGREFTAPVVTTALLNKQQMWEWFHRAWNSCIEKREFFVLWYSFIIWPKLLQL